MPIESIFSDSPMDGVPRTTTEVVTESDRERVIIRQRGAAIHRRQETLDALIDTLTAARTEVFGPRPVSGDPEVQSLRQRLEYATDGLAAISTALELNEPIEHGVQHAPPEDCVYAIQDLQKAVRQAADAQKRHDLEIEAFRQQREQWASERESLKTDRDDAIRAAESVKGDVESLRHQCMQLSHFNELLQQALQLAQRLAARLR